MPAGTRGSVDNSRSPPRRTSAGTRSGVLVLQQWLVSYPWSGGVPLLRGGGPGNLPREAKRHTSFASAICQPPSDAEGQPRGCAGAPSRCGPLPRCHLGKCWCEAGHAVWIRWCGGHTEGQASVLVQLFAGVDS